MPVAQVLAAARARYRRLSALEALDAQAAGALLVDVRTAEQRVVDGTVPGAVIVALNHLEWRLDPAEPVTIEAAGDFDRQVVVLCDEGYCSSLAAARLLDLGYRRATDVIDGFVAWRDLGLPISAPVRNGYTSQVCTGAPLVDQAW